MDIKTRLTRCCGKPVGGYKCGDGIRCPDCFDKLQGWREIEALRTALQHCVNAIAEWEKDPNNIDQFMLGVMLGAMDNARDVLGEKDKK